MIYKNQILVFIISFLIAGFFLLSTPDSAVPQTQLSDGLCCQEPTGGVCTFATAIPCCVNAPTNPPSFICQQTQVCEGQPIQVTSCECPEPTPTPPPSVTNIPTLSGWGLLSLAVVLGILGIAGFIVIRRRKVTA